MYCKKCGAKINSTDKFCPSCGLQNPAPVSSIMSPNSTFVSSPKATKTAAKKKIPGWLIVVVIAVVVIGIIASSSSGSSSLEKDLIETLPRDLTTYVLIDDGTVHTLEVKDFKIERHSENENYDTADCVIELEDENMQMTAYVTLHSRKYDTGWAVESWSEIQEPNLVVKYEPDRQKMYERVRNFYSHYKNFTTVTDDVDLDNKTYTYVCSVYDKYTYLLYTGNITLTSEFGHSGYNSSEELNEYGWIYNYPEDNIIARWDITGEWKIEQAPHFRHAYWTLNIQSVDDIVIKGDSNCEEGSYTGYIQHSYRPWDVSIDDYANYYVDDETVYNGTFEVYDPYDPESTYLWLPGGNGFGLHIYADKAEGYSFGHDVTLTYNKY